MKVLNKNFFHLIEKFRVLTQGEPRRRDFGKIRGAEEFLCCCYNELKCYLASFHVEKDVLGTGPNPSSPLSSTTIREVYTMKLWLRLRQPRSWSQNEETFAIPKKDYMF